MGLVEDTPRIPPVGRQVVGNDAGDVEVPADLQDLIEDVIHGLLYLPLGDDVDIVEDADAVLEILGLYRVLPEGVVNLQVLRFDLVEGWVLLEGGEHVYLPVLVLLLVLVQEHARVGVLAAPRCR